MTSAGNRNESGKEPTTRVAVTVTFLRMYAPPMTPVPLLPAGTRLETIAHPTVPFYRFLYNTAGEAYLWWLRRAMPDSDLAALLARPEITLHVLYANGQPAGFFEIDSRGAPDCNLAYFGLLPHAIGRGWGAAFLRAAVDAAWAKSRRNITVNTCTADHPRALRSYLLAGFRPVQAAREIWDIPRRLGLSIPDSLRID